VCLARNPRAECAGILSEEESVLGASGRSSVYVLAFLTLGRVYGLSPSWRVEGYLGTHLEHVLLAEAAGGWLGVVFGWNDGVDGTGYHGGGARG
jgi:hypothetical protein